MNQTYIHHVVCLSGFLGAMIYGRGGALIICVTILSSNLQNVLLINEFSTFFLNYRQFLLIFKKQDTRYYLWNAVAFFFAFFFSRIVFNSVASVWVIRCFYLTVKEIGVIL